MKKIILLLILLSTISCEHTENTNPCNIITSTYQRDIKPIIITKCATSSGCHGNNSPFGNFKVFSKLKQTCENGSFRERVITKKDMPLGSPLDVCELEKIKIWLREGAKNN